MSENVENLRRLYAEWEQGDFSGGREMFAPDVLFAPGSPGDAPVSGVENVAAHMRDFLMQWSGFHVVPENFAAVGHTHEGDEVVLVTERQYGTGTSSRVPIEQSFYAVWTFRDGLIRSVVWKPDREAALEAARLSA